MNSPGAIDADAPSPPTAPPSPVTPPAPRSSWSPDHVRAAVATFATWVSRPRVRLALIGAILLLVGGVFMTNSVWTLPLVVAGALMVAIAWIGRRLNGRFAVEWGESGTQLEFRAKITAPQLARSAPPVTPPNPDRLVGRGEPEPAGIIDGEAHTVEIEVSELEALIAAVETGNGSSRRP